MSSSLNKSLQDCSLDDLIKVLTHWQALSKMQRQTISAAAREVAMATDLAETSVAEMSGQFVLIANKLAGMTQRAQSALNCENDDDLDTLALKIEQLSGLDQGSRQALHQEIDALKQQRRERNKTSLDDLETVQDSLSEIITKMQFQDRNSQRLRLIYTILTSVAQSFLQMEREGGDYIAKFDQGFDETVWLDQFVSEMHLGEMKERFMQAAMTGEIDDVFDQDTAAAPKKHSDASDDIELF